MWTSTILDKFLLKLLCRHKNLDGNFGQATKREPTNIFDQNLSAKEFSSKNFTSENQLKTHLFSSPCDTFTFWGGGVRLLLRLCLFLLRRSLRLRLLDLLRLRLEPLVSEYELELDLERERERVFETEREGGADIFSGFNNTCTCLTILHRIGAKKKHLFSVLQWYFLAKKKNQNFLMSGRGS